MKQRVDEWMQFLDDHPDALRETLEPEQMYIETTFSETVDGVDYLYWYSVQGEDSRIDVEEPERWLDEKQVAFWRECIDYTFPPQNLTPRGFLLPDRVAASMRPI